MRADRVPAGRGHAASACSDRTAAYLLAASLMLLFSALEALTIGVYFLPASGAMAAAALVRTTPAQK